MFDYPAEVIMALCEAINDKEPFRKWLIENGYEHLAQFSLAVKNNRKAFDWLLKHHPQYAAFDRAIDNDAPAKMWLRKYDMGFEIILADACAGNTDAIAWLAKNGLDLYLHLAKVIKNDIDERTRYRNSF